MSTLQDITLTVNGTEHRFSAAAGMPLLTYLRDELGLTGAKSGCGYGACGACTVLIDGVPTRACVTPLSRVSGKHVETIEGLGSTDGLDPVQAAFLRHGAFQCGYCTPGMIMAVRGLLQSAAGRIPSREDVASALDGHICRCGAYQRVVDAVMDAAAILQRDGPP